MENTYYFNNLLFVIFAIILTLMIYFLYIRSIQKEFAKKEVRMQKTIDRLMNLLISKNVGEYQVLQETKEPRKAKLRNKELLRKQMEDEGVYKNGDSLDYNIVD